MKDVVVIPGDKCQLVIERFSPSPMDKVDWRPPALPLTMHIRGAEPPPTLKDAEVSMSTAIERIDALKESTLALRLRNANDGIDPTPSGCAELVSALSAIARLEECAMAHWRRVRLLSLDSSQMHCRLTLKWRRRRRLRRNVGRCAYYVQIQHCELGPMPREAQRHYSSEHLILRWRRELATLICGERARRLCRQAELKSLLAARAADEQTNRETVALLWRLSQPHFVQVDTFTSQVPRKEESHRQNEEISSGDVGSSSLDLDILERAVKDLTSGNVAGARHNADNDEQKYADDARKLRDERLDLDVDYRRRFAELDARQQELLDKLANINQQCSALTDELAPTRSFFATNNALIVRLREQLAQLHDALKEDADFQRRREQIESMRDDEERAKDAVKKLSKALNEITRETRRVCVEIERLQASGDDELARLEDAARQSELLTEERRQVDAEAEEAENAVAVICDELAIVQRELQEELASVGQLERARVDCDTERRFLHEESSNVEADRAKLASRMHQLADDLSKAQRILSESMQAETALTGFAQVDSIKGSPSKNSCQSTNATDAIEDAARLDSERALHRLELANECSWPTQASPPPVSVDDSDKSLQGRPEVDERRFIAGSDQFLSLAQTCYRACGFLLNDDVQCFVSSS